MPISIIGSLLPKFRPKILDSEYVSNHAFYPLISNEIITVRYRGGKRSCKVRNIAYASHFDHRVFQYYSLSVVGLI